MPTSVAASAGQSKSARRSRASCHSSCRRYSRTSATVAPASLVTPAGTTAAARPNSSPTSTPTWCRRRSLLPRTARASPDPRGAGARRGMKGYVGSPAGCRCHPEVAGRPAGPAGPTGRTRYGLGPAGRPRRPGRTCGRGAGPGDPRRDRADHRRRAAVCVGQMVYRTAIRRDGGEIPPPGGSALALAYEIPPFRGTLGTSRSPSTPAERITAPDSPRAEPDLSRPDAPDHQDRVEPAGPRSWRASYVRADVPGQVVQICCAAQARTVVDPRTTSVGSGGGAGLSYAAAMPAAVAWPRWGASIRA
jgi:hypothetical protein